METLIDLVKSKI